MMPQRIGLLKVPNTSGLLKIYGTISTAKLELVKSECSSVKSNASCFGPIYVDPN